MEECLTSLGLSSEEEPIAWTKFMYAGRAFLWDVTRFCSVVLAYLMLNSSEQLMID